MMRLSAATLSALASFALASCSFGNSETVLVDFGIHEYLFLRPHEVGLDVMVENPTETIMAISHLSSQPGAGANPAINLLSVFYRDKDGKEVELRIERRNSEERRRRDPLREGGLFIVQYEVETIPPGFTLFYPLIATHPDGEDIQSGGMFQARFEGPIKNTNRTKDQLDMKMTITGPEVDPALLRGLSFHTRQFASPWHERNSLLVDRSGSQ